MIELSRPEIKEIRRIRREGATLKEIALVMRMSLSTVSKYTYRMKKRKKRGELDPLPTPLDESQPVL